MTFLSLNYINISLLQPEYAGHEFSDPFISLPVFRRCRNAYSDIVWFDSSDRINLAPWFSTDLDEYLPILGYNRAESGLLRLFLLFALLLQLFLSGLLLHYNKYNINE
jgi:hypothetical protein